MKMFAVCLLLVLCVGTNEVFSAELSQRLVGSQPAATGQFPFFVEIGRGTGADFILYCGGTLINLRWVLTAAQCQRQFEGNTDRARLSTSEAGYQEHVIQQFVAHPSYTGNAFTLRAPYDVALAQLQEVAVLTNTVQLASLPTPNDCNNNGNFVAVGRGSIIPLDHPFSHTFDFASPQLRWMQVPRINNTDCAQQLLDFGDPFAPLDDTMLCTNGSNAGICQSICGVDKGGPLVPAGTNIVVGIIGFTSLPCGIGGPSIYANVCNYSSFINCFI